MRSRKAPVRLLSSITKISSRMVSRNRPRGRARERQNDTQRKDQQRYRLERRGTQISRQDAVHEIEGRGYEERAEDIGVLKGPCGRRG